MIDVFKVVNISFFFNVNWGGGGFTLKQQHQTTEYVFHALVSLNIH